MQHVRPIHTLLFLGDSQTGATWSKTYFGNYLQQCLNGDFKIYGQGGSVVRTWMNGGLENIDIVETLSYHCSKKYW
jgi:hypothetical protein